MHCVCVCACVHCSAGQHGFILSFRSYFFFIRTTITLIGNEFYLTCLTYIYIDLHTGRTLLCATRVFLSLFCRSITIIIFLACLFGLKMLLLWWYLIEFFIIFIYIFVLLCIVNFHWCFCCCCCCCNFLIILCYFFSFIYRSFSIILSHHVYKHTHIFILLVRAHLCEHELIDMDWLCATKVL